MSGRVEIRQEVIRSGDRAGEEPGYYFVVIGGNDEPVAVSEIYDSASNANRGYQDLREIILSEPPVVRVQRPPTAAEQFEQLVDQAFRGRKA